MVAEKLHAMVELGVTNSRVKDFYDVWTMSALFAFQGDPLANAIRATFDRRGTAVPSSMPVALTEQYSDASGREQQWTSFIGRGDLGEVAVDFAQVVKELQAFLMPPLTAVAKDGGFPALWRPGGPWANP
jgi:hypothetical protein